MWISYEQGLRTGCSRSSASEPGAPETNRDRAASLRCEAFERARMTAANSATNDDAARLHQALPSQPTHAPAMPHHHLPRCRRVSKDQRRAQD